MKTNNILILAALAVFGWVMYSRRTIAVKIAPTATAGTATNPFSQFIPVSLGGQFQKNPGEDKTLAYVKAGASVLPGLIDSVSGIFKNWGGSSAATQPLIPATAPAWTGADPVLSIDSAWNGTANQAWV